MKSSVPSRESAPGQPALSRRQFLLASAATAGGALMPSMARAAQSAAGPDLAPTAAEPWAPHPKAAPRTTKRTDAFTIAANGTRTCTGGWQWRYDGIVGGRGYEISMDVQHRGIAVPRDALKCTAIWGAQRPTQSSPGTRWEYLLPRDTAADRLTFTRRIVAPEGATTLTMRATLRWTADGETVWQVPRVIPIGPVQEPGPVRISVVTGEHAARLRRRFDVQQNIEFYGQLCEEACRRDQPGLIVLPETALQWGVRGHPLDLAVPATGPETEAFAALARKHRVRIALGMYEREGDAVFNSLVVLSPSGSLEGRYRKVHLAHGEDLSGVLPGDSFPVIPTEQGRIGCNICMDSMVPESARIAALNGADLLLLPIMGDFRADRWDLGSPVFHEDRWRTIMRAQALDNQFSLVVARNRSAGSCIINRQGEFLAWNDGKQPFVTADLPRADDFCSWNGSCFRDSAWLVRRPHLYDALTNPSSHGGLT